MTTEYSEYTFIVPEGASLTIRTESNSTVTMILKSPYFQDQYWNSGVTLACTVVTAGVGLMTWIVAKNPKAVEAITFLAAKGCTYLGEKTFFSQDTSGAGGGDGGFGSGGTDLGGGSPPTPSDPPPKTGYLEIKPASISPAPEEMALLSSQVTSNDVQTELIYDNTAETSLPSNGTSAAGWAGGDAGDSEPSQTPQRDSELEIAPLSVSPDLVAMAAVVNQTQPATDSGSVAPGQTDLVAKITAWLTLAEASDNVDENQPTNDKNGTVSSADGGEAEADTLSSEEATIKKEAEATSSPKGSEAGATKSDLLTSQEVPDTSLGVDPELPEVELIGVMDPVM